MAEFRAAWWMTSVRAPCTIGGVQPLPAVAPLLEPDPGATADEGLHAFPFFSGSGSRRRRPWSG